MIVLALVLLALVLVLSTAPQYRTPSTAATPSTVTASTNPAANLDQCTNGQVGPPLVREPCLKGVALGGPSSGSSFANWVNGNSNGQKSHWREGEFIAYRATITSLSAGTHTLVMQYDTVHGAKHAIDYLGSFDATETTALASTTFHYNFNNPCVDILGATACPQSTAPVPISTLTILPANLINCAGSAGGPIVQAAGSFKMFAAGGSLLSMSYPSQNTVAGTGQCSTQVSLVFTVPSGVSTVVIAWGGHIASQLDWGFGNSASAISGSPYHMALVTLDGASTGSQDRALATNAIFFTPTITTSIFNAATNTALPGTPQTAPAGTTVYDTATLTAISPVAGGTVWYAFFTNGVCGGAPVTNETVTVTNAVVPNSPNHGPLAAGSYSFKAYYTGDSGSNAFPANSACEPLTITSVTPTITTSVSPSTLTLGLTPVSATDTATLSGGSSPTGTITFTVYYNDASCAAANLVFTSNAVTVSGDGHYTSNAFTPTKAGTYYWIASYSGDTSNHAVSTACGDSGETLTVQKASPNVVTSVSQASITLADATFTVTDTATLSGGFSPTGSITFTVFSTAGCTGTPLFTSTKTVSGNGAYTSDAYTIPGVGTYYWIASYSGDANNLAFATKCGEANEVVHVSPAVPTITTVATPSSFQLTTTSQAVADTATLSGGFAPTGTIVFTLYYNDGTCSAANLVFTSSSITVTGNGGYSSTPTYTPTKVGTYYWIAAYSGDANNDAFTTHCGDSGEVVTVSPSSPSVTTSVSPSSITLGNGVFTATDTATLSGGYNPTGSITFTVFNTAGCTGSPIFTSTVSVASGNGAYTSGVFTVPGTGTYYWIAAYSGDSNNNAFTTKCGDAGETLTVSPASPAVTTSVSPSTITLGSNPPYTAFDTATLSGAFAPTGSITFSVYFDDASCTSTPVFTSTVTVHGNGAYPSGTMTVTQAGTYRWVAAYSGDANNNAFTTGCGDSNEILTVSPAGPTVTTSVSPSAFTLTTTSQPVTDAATLSGGFNPTGSITFTVYHNDASCGAANLVFTSNAIAVSGNGVYTSAPAFWPTAAGTYRWVASYTGDANNNGFTTACGDSGETLVVSPAGPTVVTEVSNAAITLSNGVFTVTDTATLSGGFNPTGTITFNVYNSAGCTGSSLFTSTKTVNGNGPYTSDAFTVPGVGTYYWIAAYSGDSNNNGFTTKCGDANEVVVVSPASPGVATVASPSSFQLTTSSQPVTDTATLSGGFAPTGTIIFTLYFNDASCGAANLVFTSSAIAVSGNGAYTSAPTYTPTLAGTYNWIAAYSGDANNNAFTTTCGETGETVTVLPAGPGLTTTVSPSSIVLGNGIFTATDTAHLSGGFAPTGTITFNVYNTAGCAGGSLFTSAVTVNGNGDYTSAAFTVPGVGTYYWIAAYSGDANNNAKTTACGDAGETLTVSPASPSVSTSVSPSTITLGSNPPYTAFDTATLAGAFQPTGTITFTVYFNDATCSAGSLVFTSSVSVSGDGSYPSATLTVSAAGTYYWVASYSGDANNNAFSTKCGDAGEVLTVNAASPGVTTLVSPATITLGPNPPYTATDTATLSGGFAPTGTITFTVFNTAGCTGSPIFTSTVSVTGGNGAYTSAAFTVPGVGTYYWIAAYSGDANNNAFTTGCGDSGETLTVLSASPGVTTAVSPSSIVLGPNPPYTATDTATLSGGFAPTGTIAFTVFGNALCSGPVLFTSVVSVAGNGAYTSDPFTVPGAGTFYWVADYSGDANNKPFISACGDSGEILTVSLAPPTVTTALSQESIVLSDATFTVTDTATLSGGFAPTGSITWTVFSTAGCTGSPIFTSTKPVSGNGLYTSDPFTVPGVGTYSWIAAYSGDANNQPFTTGCGDLHEVLTVTPASPGVTTAVSPAAITLGDGTFTAADTATLSGGFAPTGTITFSVYGNALCSGPALFTNTKTVSGDGAYTSDPFTVPGAGTFYWVADYSGDSNNNAFVSACGETGEVLTVSPASPSVTTALTPESIVLGSNPPYTAFDTATLSGGFAPTGSITFTVFNTAGCTGSPIFTDVEPVSGNGAYPSATFTVPSTGTYTWIASYSGDANNNAFTTGCGDNHEVLTVTASSPTVITAVSPASITLSDNVFTATDTAFLSGGFAPTGTITFTVFGNAGCTGSPLFTSTVPVTSGNGAYTSAAFTVPGVGTYYWVASYSGDANNNGFTTKCGDANEVITVSPASPGVITAVSAASVTLTDSTFTVTDTATLSGGFAPTGTITFNVYNSAGCTGSSLFTSTKTVSGNGAYTSDPFTIPGVGTYYWIAAYSGDSNNNAFTTGCGDANEVVTVSPASPSVVTRVSTESITLGDATFTVTDTATLSGGFAPTGSILFSVFDNAACSGTPLFTSTKTVSGNGDYTSDAFTIPGAGTYYWVASYSGDGNNNAFTSGCNDPHEVVAVAKAPPTVTTVASPAKVTLGDSVFTATDTATLSGGFAPTGTITFNVYNSAGCAGGALFTSTKTVSGNGAYTSDAFTVPGVGTYYWVAAYSGDANNNAFTTGCGDANEVVTVSPASPGVITAVSTASVTLSNGVFTVTDTATLSGGFAPLGTITFNVYNSAGCSGSSLFTSTKTVAGNGAYTSDPFTIPGVGTYYWIASYSGDANNNAFTTGCGDANEIVTVSPASPNVVTQVSAESITLGDASFQVTDTATLSGGFAPTGTITFTVFSTAGCTGSPLFTSTKTVSGNGDYTSDPFTIPGAGTYSWIASYSGDGNNNAFTTKCNDPHEVVTVAKAPPNVTTAVSSETIKLGDSTFQVTDTATLTGGFAPTGTIVFNVYNSAGCSGSSLFTSTKTVNGNGDYTSDAFTIPGVGTYSWIASYSGDANDNAFTTGCGDAHEVVTVSPASPNVVTQVSSESITLGDAAFQVTDTATLSGGFAPTGSITFTVFNTAGCTGSPIFTSTVSVAGNNQYTSDPFTIPGAGTYSWIASYSGDANNNAFTTGCGDAHEVVTVQKAPPTVTTAVSAESITLGDSTFTVTDTATLSGGFAPTGTIVFNVYNSAGCTGSSLFTSTKTVSGNGPYTSDAFTIPGAGTYYWIAAYSGDANNLPFTTGCGDPHEVVTVSPAQPGVVTALSAETITLGTTSATVTDTATLSGGFAPTGTITFSVYGNAACTGTVLFTSTVNVNGNGAYPSDPYTIPGAGTYYWIAAYSGDANNNAFTTGCGDPHEVLTVSPASPAVTTALSTEGFDIPLNSQPVTDTATLSGGFNPTGTITFTVYRNDASCGAGSLVFTSNAIAVSGNGAYTSAPAFTPTQVGTYRWIAAYSGDANNNAFTTGCGDAHEVLTVTPSPGTIIVKKVALGGDGLFGYTTTGGSNLPSSFSIQTTGGTGTVTFTGIDVQNTYSIAESSMPSGWFLVSVSCSDGSNGVDPSGFNVPAGGTVTCTFQNTRSFGQVTDTSFCPFDTDPNVAGAQFNVLFTKSGTGYKISATNPGQFYYNVFFYGTPGSTVTITANLPWPFVTQGAQPVHVYSGFGVTSSGCLLQNNDVTNGFRISGTPVTLSSYGTQKNGQTATITLTGKIPSTGLAYVTIHIMWGLNKSSGWSPVGGCSGACVADAKNVNGLELPNNFAYGFAFSGTGQTGSQTTNVYNENRFQN